MIMHARYLLFISTFSDAHAALSSAISAAMHMGLHLDDSASHNIFTKAERYNRRRVFAVLNMMETYLAYVLGLPRALRAACAKQTLGLPDEDLLDEGKAFISHDPTRPAAESVLNQKLVKIHAKIHDHQFDAPEGARMAASWMAGIEGELKDWERELPPLPEDSASTRFVLGQMTLRLSYTGIQILFYAPCIPHLARASTDADFDPEGFKYGSMCVRAATEAVLVSQTLHAHDVLSEAHWLPRYVLAWAATTLIYFVIYSRARVTIEETKRAALAACQMLAVLGESNVATKRIYECLAPYRDVVAATDA